MPTSYNFILAAVAKLLDVFSSILPTDKKDSHSRSEMMTFAPTIVLVLMNIEHGPD